MGLRFFICERGELIEHRMPWRFVLTAFLNVRHPDAPVLRKLVYKLVYAAWRDLRPVVCSNPAHAGLH
jgi:hypothetical protein